MDAIELKAKQLVNKFRKQVNSGNTMNSFFSEIRAKECAIIHCNEVMEVLQLISTVPESSGSNKQFFFYNAVKEKIETL